MKRFVIFMLMAAGIAVFSIAQTNGTSNQGPAGIGGGFRQEGIASWYGSEFDGKPTASGELFNSDLFTAAHPTLPFGTVLTITNTQNNVRVNVRINDRGPFVAARIVDLSKAAAEVLDMLITGTAPVILEQAASNAALGPAGEAPLIAEAPVIPLAPVISPAPTPAPSPAPVVEVPLAPIATREEVIVPVTPAPVAAPSPAPVPAPSPAPEPLRTSVAEVPPPQRVEVIPQQPSPVITQPPSPVVSQQPSPVITQPPQAPVITPRPAAPVVVTPAPPPPVTYSAAPARIIGGIPPVGTNKQYRLQVGAFRVPRNAVEAFDRLKNAGLRPAYEQHGDLYRVVLPGLQAAEVQIVAQTLGNAGFQEALIREEK